MDVGTSPHPHGGPWLVTVGAPQAQWAAPRRRPRPSTLWAGEAEAPRGVGLPRPHAVWRQSRPAAPQLTGPRGLCSHAVLGFSTTEAAMTASPWGNGLPSCLHSSCTTPPPSPGPAAAASTSPGSWSKSAGPVGGRPVSERHGPVRPGWTERSPRPSPCPATPQEGEGSWGPRDGAGVEPWVWDGTETRRGTAPAAWPQSPGESAARGTEAKACPLFLILSSGDRVFDLLFNVVLG